ncbi:PUA domain-containing protein [Streptococcus pyogenes]
MEGDFEVGNIIAVYSQKSHRLIGKGRVKISSLDLRDMLDNQHAEGVFIHRNDWVTL